MKFSDIEYVDKALDVSHYLLFAGCLLTALLVLSCGSLIPVWMFLNSLQLIVYVVLIPTKLPGNAHHFLLEHLNILRLHLFGLTDEL